MTVTVPGTVTKKEVCDHAVPYKPVFDLPLSEDERLDIADV